MGNTNFLTVEKLYRSLETLTKVQLDTAFDSIQSWSNETVNDMNQLRKDIFGAEYFFDQDGLRNLASPLFSLTAGSSNTGTSALNWEFTGALTLPSLVTVNQTTADLTLSFSNPSDARVITFPDPGGNDSVVYLNAVQTLTNKTMSGLTISSPLDVNSAAGVDSIINLKNNGSNVYSIYWEHTSGDFRLNNGSGSLLIQLSTVGLLQLNGVGAAPIFTLNAPANTNPSLRFSEGGATKWTAFNNNSGDTLELSNASNASVVSFSQSGQMTVSSTAGNQPSIIANAPSNTSSWFGLYESGARKWQIFNFESNDNLRLINAAGSGVVDFNQSGELLLPDSATPAAGYGAKKSFAWCWAGVSSTGTLSTTHHNITSSSKTATGTYNVVVGTNFTVGDYQFVAMESGTNNIVCGTSAHATTDFTIVTKDSTTGTNTDASFSVVAYGA